MPPEVSTVNAETEDHFLNPAKGKSVCSRGSQNIDLLDRAGALRTKKLQAGPEKNMFHEQSVVRGENLKGRSSMSTSEVYQKPRPKKKLNGDEELVKHMSYLPRYLQRREKEDNIQEKALNVGVLDWGLLERWSYHQKCTASEEQGQSTSSASKLIPVSTSRLSNTGKCGIRHLESKDMANKAIVPPCSKNLPATLRKDDDTKTNNLARTRDGRLKDFAGDVPKYLENSKCVQDHNARENDKEKNTGTESSLWKDNWLIERNDKNFADMIFDNVMDMHRYTDVPHSCPLPQNTSSNPNTEPGFICKSQKPLKCEAKATNIGGNRKPHNVLSTAEPKWMSRSSSLKVSLIGELKLSAGPDKLDGDNASKNNNSRQSPLRRMLDPLLKPKSHLQSSGRSAASPGRHSYEPSKSDKSLIYGLHKSSDTSYNSVCKAKVDMNMPAEESYNRRRSLQVDKHGSSRRQALLQLAWKNGFPLFMLSSSDNDVLVATIAPKRTSSNDDSECMYTIFFVNESKKKRMMWSNKGNKGKNDQLVSSVVGQIKVSTARYRSNDFSGNRVVKEFVLIGSELVLNSTENVDFSYKSELAAIVVNSSKGNVCNDDGKILQTDEISGSSSAPGISVILPSSVHGLPKDGGPSPLIHRWRSGGACDCGGWDEGCILTILKADEDSSFQVCQKMDGSQRLELFIQGRPGDKHPVFSIVSFKEGLYTIDFTSSIALVQAFAICIATLHARNPNKNSAEFKSLHENLVNDRVATTTPARSRLGDTTSYIPNCPPLSPVARA